MKRIFLLSLLFLTACGTPTPMPDAVKVNPQAFPATPSQNGLGDSFYPLLGNASYDVTHYEITLDVDPVANRIEGTTVIEAVALEDLSQFNLDLYGLKVDSVLVNGESAEFSRYQMELVISPRAERNAVRSKRDWITANESFTVTASYHGSPKPIGDDGIHMLSGWQTMPGGTFVASEPSGAMTWFPCNNHWSDRATFTFNITVPKGYDIVANGVPFPAKERLGFSMQTWVESEPMSTYLATVVIGKYDLETQTTASGLHILNYFPVDTSDDLRDDFVRTPEMIEFYSGLIGPYPFESYGVVMANQPLGFALETQTRSLFGNAGTKEEVVAHELAHQWFGDNLTISSWEDLWLKEGFATYMSYLWLEHSQGKAAFEQKIQATYDDSVMDEFGLAFEPIGSLRPKAANELYHPSTYFRGALALHALRLEVGDEVFFTILREFYTRYAGKTASTDDFVAVAQEISGRDLTEFFTLWLEMPSMPPKPGISSQVNK